MKYSKLMAMVMWRQGCCESDSDGGAASPDGVEG
jgi:hypothetical protein